MKAETLIAERPTLDGVIHAELRRRIITLAYRPGTMIFENAVAAEFAVSRTPVRQAFFRLAREDLLQVLPQRGARISSLSVAKVKEAQVIRESLEITAFGDVAKRWDEGSPVFQRATRAILDCIAAQAAAVAQGDHLRFMALDEEYHSIVLRLLGNATMLAILGDMRAHLSRLRYLELQEARHEAQAVVHHEQILAALRAGDVAATRRRLRAHLKMLEEFREKLFAKHADVFG